MTSDDDMIARDGARHDDARDAFEKLLDIIKRLRSPEGCKWDREQTPHTLRASIVEEAWECVSAIEERDDGNLQEELGDLYLLATMVSWMKEQEGSFTVASVLARIAAKLLRRHPHVFGGPKIELTDEILAQWETIKSKEHAEHRASNEHALQRTPGAGSLLDGLPRFLPPLEKARQMQGKAAKAGFDWPEPGPVWEKVAEEIGELRDAVKKGEDRKIEEELGDLLFTVVNLARILKVDPSVALHGANGRFDRRFREIEKRLAERGISPSQAGLAVMDALWNQIKAEE